MPENKQQNRLAKEKSPYLLQHADNPVDWYPWGKEAFEEARKRDLPIFLSIGYSTCHWCHVMEHESFENPAIAEMINANFIPVKVDREERPDLDNIYMSAVMAMTGRGGWPLTVLLTHDKKPFYGGTYFPPTAKWGSPGITDVIESVATNWKNRREELIASSNTLTALLKENSEAQGEASTLDKSVLDSAYAQFDQSFDAQYGGFGYAPKFPSSHNLSFLFRYWKRTGSARALEMAEHTLKQMARGGMYDHLGGGFHRYATDQRWQVPHFEKMLYDQAMLSRTYLEAYQITGNETYAQVAREIFDYVLRDMQDDKGGFYSAEDADSLDPDEYKGVSLDPSQNHEKKEGAFFLWRKDEIDQLLGEQDANIFNRYYGVNENGNAFEDPHGEFIGKNIIYIDNDIRETAAHFKISEDEVRQIIQRSKAKLLSERRNRPRPHLDDKVLTDWNGLMISSLAFGSRVLKDERYKNAAVKSAEFILSKMMTDKGRLLHRFRDGDAGITGTIEDYAYFVHGLIDLYEATFDLKYLKEALRLSDEMITHFWDEEEGGFYFTADDAEELLYRQKETYDGAIPSGNSIAALNLIRLSALTIDIKWEEKYTELFKAFGVQVSGRASSHAQMLIALDYALGPTQEVVIAVESKETGIQDILDAVYSRFLPRKVAMLRPATGGDSEDVVSISPFVKHQLPLNGKTTIYLCENHVCKLPLSDLERFKKELDGNDE